MPAHFVQSSTPSAGRSIAISLSGLLIVGAPSVTTRIESEGVVLGYQVNSTAGTVESLFTLQNDDGRSDFWILWEFGNLG